MKKKLRKIVKYLFNIRKREYNLTYYFFKRKKKKLTRSLMVFKSR